MKPDSAGRYTHGHERSTLAAHSTRTAANSAAYLLPHLKPGMKLLDIGCGPGAITLDLAAWVAPGQVIGLENTEAPLLAARAEAAARANTSTLFQIGDALKLPFENASFDVVHAHQVLQHLTDPVTALREMQRVGKAGGQSCFLETAAKSGLRTVSLQGHRSSFLGYESRSFPLS